MENENDAPSLQSPSGEHRSKRRRTSINNAHPPREVGLMRNLPSEKFSSFIGSASGIHFIRSVYGAIRHSQSSTGAHIQTPERDVVPGEDDCLPSDIPGPSRRIWKDHEFTSRHDSQITFQDLIKWSGSYFANWHPAYPFLHAQAVLDFFHKISQDGVPNQDTHQDFEMIILRSIMSISLADRRQDPTFTGSQILKTLVFQSYDEAINSLQTILSRPASIQALQAATSVQLFLVSMLRLNAASRLGGVIIRMALQLGLHRCPNRFPSFTSVERELRQRLFWSLYCVDRLICQSMGLPLSLRDDDIDVCYPSKERHQAQSVSSDPRLRLVEFLARHSEIRGQIMELRNKSIQHSERETDQAVAITAKLAQWWNDIEEFSDIASPVMSTYHRTVLIVLHHESIISLNRPILALSTTTPAYHAALQHCLGSSRSIISALHEAICQERNDSEQRAAQSLLWPSFTWAVWMSTFILFHAANSKHISQSMVSRLAERSLTILHHVSQRGNVWPDACASVIRNLRLHLLHRTTISTDEGSTPQNPPNSALIKTPSPSMMNPSTTRPTSAFPDPKKHTVRLSQQFSVLAPCSKPSEQQTNVIQENDQSMGSASVPSVVDGLRSTWIANHNYVSQICDTPTVSSELPMGSDNVDSGSLDPDINFGLLQWSDYMQNNNETNDMLPLLTNNCTDLFDGFDIPFWLGQDEYSWMVNEWG